MKKIQNEYLRVTFSTKVCWPFWRQGFQTAELGDWKIAPVLHYVYGHQVAISKRNNATKTTARHLVV